MMPTDGEGPQDILNEFMHPDYVKPEDLVIGEMYRVEWEDCCVRGTYWGTFSGFQHNGDLQENFAVFDSRFMIRGSASISRLPDA